RSHRLAVVRARDRRRLPAAAARRARGIAGRLDRGPSYRCRRAELRLEAALREVRRIVWING
ncbi:hypothetical protein, partial [Streptomyces tubercidicus]